MSESFDKAFKKSNILELVTEDWYEEEIAVEYEEGETPGEGYEIAHSAVITFRVDASQEKVWLSTLVKILRMVDEQEDFGIEIGKSYYLDEGKKPKFIWKCTIWGDKINAISSLSPYFSKRAGPPPPPPSVARSIAPQNKRQLSRAAKAGVKKTLYRDGTEVTTIPIPCGTQQGNIHGSLQTTGRRSSTRGIHVTGADGFGARPR